MELPAQALAMRPVFRFAPSPNGDLHLGHARSALLNADAAAAAGGRLLVRIEDIDGARARPAFEARILDDLDWLGLDYERPVRRQSGHVAAYRVALEALAARGLVYPSFATRAEVQARVTAHPDWPRDPDGAPLHARLGRDLDSSESAARIAAGESHNLRLDMARALAVTGALTFVEEGRGRLPADPAAWGDVVLARKDAPASYHLAVVVDDAAQGVTHVIRGADLLAATAVHRVLQVLLGLPAPMYRHHALVLDADGRKLSKSAGSTSLRVLRAAGATPEDIRRLTLLGLA